jgi:hypothetical protein
MNENIDVVALDDALKLLAKRDVQQSQLSNSAFLLD